MRIGLISDTHGLLRASALEALRGSARIIHAGDIGPAHLLQRLAAQAPLTVVRGNNDSESWAQSLPEQARLKLGSIRVLVIHDLNTLEPAIGRWQPQVIVSGRLTPALGSSGQWRAVCESRERRTAALSPADRGGGAADHGCAGAGTHH